MREAGCNEGGAGCKYDSSCSAQTWQVLPLRLDTCFLPSSSNICFIFQVQTPVFIFLSGSHVALWPRTKVLWPRGKTAFVQLQLRSVLRRNDWQGGHTAAESRPGRLNLVQSGFCHLVCAEISILMTTFTNRFYTYPQPPKPSMLHVIDGTWKVRF